MMCCLFQIFNLTWFLSVLSLNRIIVQFLLWLIFVKFRISTRPRWLGWVIESTIFTSSHIQKLLQLSVMFPWHSRLGHPSFTKISVIGTELHFDPVNEDLTHCSVCHLSKQRRLSYLSNGTLWDNPFDLIHIDIWGLFL